MNTIFKMGFIKLIYLLIVFNFVNSKTYNIKIPPDGKTRQLTSGNSDGTAEIEWILETTNNYKIKISCTMKVMDCFKATLTIDNGKEERSYCGDKAAGTIQQSSHENKMTVNLLTRDAPNSAICHASAVKSFIDFEEPVIDSSEAGVNRGLKGTTCPCGWANKNNARIVGGKKASVNEFSFPVVIVRKDKKIAFCGGSVITAYHILTAAHCTYTLKKGVPLVVGVGEHDLGTAKETNATQFIPVESIVQHPEFDGLSKLNDIAILVLKEEIKFNNIVGPVCLPNEKIELEGKFVKVMGWGKLCERGPQSKVLMKANLKIVDIVQCAEFYRKLRLDDPNQFCTYGNKKDTCSGDSGGPVVWLDPDTNRYTQVGVVSFGRGCASEDVPGVNTDVFYFIEWIKKTIQETKPSFTCSKN